MSKISSFKLTGLVPATFTPMKENGDVDYDRFGDYCKYLSDNGLTQIYANGTTGEGFSLSLDERKKVMEKWMEFGRNSGRLQAVIAQVGALNLKDTIELTLVRQLLQELSHLGLHYLQAEHAASIGVDAFATVPPLFFKPKNTEALVQYCKAVAAVAPELPFYFYHVPVGTAVQLNMEDFLTAAMKEIPNLVGVKFSDKDLIDMIGCVHMEAPHRDDKRFNVLYGTDAQLLAGLATGADGGVGSTYNILPALVHRLADNVGANKLSEARLDQIRHQKFARIVMKYGAALGNTICVQKAVLKWVGIDLGPVRAPLWTPSADVLDSVKTELTEIGFFDWK